MPDARRGRKTPPSRPPLLSTTPFQSRPVAMGSRAAVSAPHLLAARAAIDVLDAGGNAVDAAVAAAAVSTVVQPFSSSIAGVGWANVYERATGKTEVLQFHGAAPVGLDVSGFTAGPSGMLDWQTLEARGAALLGSLVPAAVSGWEALLARKGSWPLSRCPRERHSAGPRRLPGVRAVAPSHQAQRCEIGAVASQRGDFRPRRMRAPDRRAPRTSRPGRHPGTHRRQRRC